MDNICVVNYKKIEEENRELKIVMRKLTHEMGNALSVLGSSIYYLEKDETLSNSIVVKDIKGDYLYICDLLGQLRDYNHCNVAEKKEIVITDLLEIIKNVFSKLEGNKDCSFAIFAKEDAKYVKVRMDITKIRQVIINIMKNCVEAMEDNNEKKGKKLNVSVSIVNGEVHIVFIDNGKGIEDKYVGEMFKPMFTYGKEKGTGLGLSVVKKIVEDHGGKIKAVSVLGTGTAIHTYFPIVK